MDKGRHPHVIRTWTVERTKTHYRPLQQSKLRLDPHQTLPGPARHLRRRSCRRMAMASRFSMPGIPS